MKWPSKILLVDDDETSLYVTQRIFKRMEPEAAVLMARHGQEALDFVKEVYQGEKCPELILLDINMPVMDGFTFLEEIQKSLDLSSIALKIILLSSSRHHLDLDKAQKYPITGYIEKPLTPEKLSKFL